MHFALFHSVHRSTEHPTGATKKNHDKMHMKETFLFFMCIYAEIKIRTKMSVLRPRPIHVGFIVDKLAVR